MGTVCIQLVLELIPENSFQFKNLPFHLTDLVASFPKFSYCSYYITRCRLLWIEQWRWTWMCCIFTGWVPTSVERTCLIMKLRPSGWVDKTKFSNDLKSQALFAMPFIWTVSLCCGILSKSLFSRGSSKTTHSWDVKPCRCFSPWASEIILLSPWERTKQTLPWRRKRKWSHIFPGRKKKAESLRNPLSCFSLQLSLWPSQGP